MDTREQDLLQLVKDDRWMMSVLQAAAGLALPDWWIGAGFVRGKVWDVLHGFEKRTRLADVDVIYFNSADLRREADDAAEAALRAQWPDIPWSVRNQARMHLRNDDAPYASCEDALRYWLETATCVAVRLETDGVLKLLAPYGLDDLFDLILRPTPAGQRRRAEYDARLAKKNWPGLWPSLRLKPD